MPDNPEIKKLLLIERDGTETMFSTKDDLYVNGLKASLDDVLERIKKREEFWIEARQSPIYKESIKPAENDWEKPTVEHEDMKADIFYWVSDIGQMIVFR
jgi:hypothetical protein